MNHVEALLETIALELVHARLRQLSGEMARSCDDREANLEWIITAKAHVLSLAAAAMLTAKFEY